jgi:hypothetical protein
VKISNSSITASFDEQYLCSIVSEKMEINQFSSDGKKGMKKFWLFLPTLTIWL